MKPVTHKRKRASARSSDSRGYRGFSFMFGLFALHYCSRVAKCIASTKCLEFQPMEVDEPDAAADEVCICVCVDVCTIYIYI